MSWTNLINKVMRENRVSEYGLADLTGIRQPTLHDLRMGKTKTPQPNTIKRLEDNLGIVIDDLGEEITYEKVIKMHPHIVEATGITRNTFPLIAGDLTVYLNCLITKQDPPTDGTVCMPCPLQNCAAIQVIDTFNQPIFLEGDLILACPHEAIKNGDMVAVYLKNGSGFACKWFENSGGVTLTFGDPNRNPIVVDKSEVLIKVKIVQSNRSFN